MTQEIAKQKVFTPYVAHPKIYLEQEHAMVSPVIASPDLFVPFDPLAHAFQLEMRYDQQQLNNIVNEIVDTQPRTTELNSKEMQLVIEIANALKLE